MNRFENIWSNIYFNIVKNNNKLYQLILINIVVFVLFGFIEVFFNLFKIPDEIYTKFERYFSLSAHPSEIVRKPWTIVSYMFMHGGFLHIIINMLLFYWFGKIFQEYLRDRKLVATYLMGGISGGLIYILAYQTFPALTNMHSYMVGASAGVIAIIVATATLLPNNSMNLMFLGPVKLKYIAIVFVLLDVISLRDMENIGGHFAHLGGAFYGYIYIKLLQGGTDIGGWLSGILDMFRAAFKPKPKFKVHKGGQYHKNPNAKQASSKEKSAPKTDFNQLEIDSILDKIAKSGYDSLSEREKDVLFNASKK